MTAERPCLLDLFCGAGGAAKGYFQAGFHIVGVDFVEQPRYPFKFICADVMTLDMAFLASFDAIHASPPRQRYSSLAGRNGNAHDWPDMIDDVRKMLEASGKRYVLYNVPLAPLREAKLLCGTMFSGLRVLRHRLFETNFSVTQPPCGAHPLVHTHNRARKHYGKTDEWRDFVQVTGGGNCSVASARDAMGISWATKKELNEAIPPKYTEYVGAFLREALR